MKWLSKSLLFLAFLLPELLLLNPAHGQSFDRVKKNGTTYFVPPGPFLTAQVGTAPVAPIDVVNKAYADRMLLFSEPANGVVAFGDSVCAYTGVSSQALAWEPIVAAKVGGINSNRCVGGSQIGDVVTNQMFGATSGLGIYQPTATGNPIVIENPIENDILHCLNNGSGSASSIAGCPLNAAYNQRTLDTWTTTRNKVYALTAPQTGTWGTDTNLPTLALQSSTAGSTLTLSYVQPANTSASCAVWEAVDGGTGQASLKLDGLLADTLTGYGFSGQTVKSDQGTTWNVFTQCYPTAPGSHVATVKVSTGTFSFVAMLTPDDPALRGYQPPRLLSLGLIYFQADAQSAVTAQYNSQKLGVAAILSGYGFPVQGVDVRVKNAAGVNLYSDPVYDMASSPVTKPDGTPCAASTAPPYHPNDCGHRDEANAVLAWLQPSSAAGGSTGISQYATAPANLEAFPNLNESNLLSTTGLNPGGICSHCNGGYDFLYGIVSYVTDNNVPGGLNYASYLLGDVEPAGYLWGPTFYSIGGVPTTVNGDASSTNSFSRPFLFSYNAGTFFAPITDVGSHTLGATGTPFTLERTIGLNLTPVSVPPGGCTTQTFPVTGLLSADYVYGFNPPQPPGPLGSPTVSADRTVAGVLDATYCNWGSAVVTPNAGLFTMIAKH